MIMQKTNMRLGNALLRAKSTKQDSFKRQNHFSRVRNGEGAGIEEKAESSFMMGECRKELKDWGAGFVPQLH